MRQVDLAANHVREAEAGRRGVLEIGSTSPPMGSVLPRVIRAFRAANPEITLVVRMMYSNDILEELAAWRIQVGFGRGGWRQMDSASEELWEPSVPRRFATRSPASEPEICATPKGLSGETLITYPRKLPSANLTIRLIAFCHAHGFKPKAVEEVTDAASILGLVTCGLGVSIGPFTGGLDAADVVTRPIAASGDWRFPISAYWRTDGHSPLLETLLDVARSFDA